MTAAKNAKRSQTPTKKKNLSARSRVRNVRNQVLPRLRGIRDNILSLAQDATDPLVRKNLEALHANVQTDVDNMATLFESHEDTERAIEGKGTIWYFIETILSFIPLFKAGVTRQGGSTSQYCAAAVVILGLIFAAALAFLLSFCAVEFVCTFSGAEKCAALANHIRVRAVMRNKVSTPSAAGVTTAGALGYHGPFADAVLTAMPYKPVARGFWTAELPRGEAGANAFCTTVFRTLVRGQNARSIPMVHMENSMNCKSCMQQHNAPYTPQSIMTCLAPLHFRGYDLWPAIPAP